MVLTRILHLHVLLHFLLLLLLLLLPPTTGVTESSERQTRILVGGVLQRDKDHRTLPRGSLGELVGHPPAPPPDALSITVPSSGVGVLNPWLYKFPPWHVPLNPEPSHFKPKVSSSFSSSSSGAKNLHGEAPNTFSDLMDGDVIIDLSHFVEAGPDGGRVQNVRVPASSPYRDELVKTLLEKNGAGFSKTKAPDPGQVASLTSQGLAEVAGEDSSIKVGEPIISFVVNEHRGDGKTSTNTAFVRGGSRGSHVSDVRSQVHSGVPVEVLRGREIHSGTVVGPDIHSVSVNGLIGETGTPARSTIGGGTPSGYVDFSGGGRVINSGIGRGAPHGKLLFNGIVTSAIDEARYTIEDGSVAPTIAPPHATANRIESPPFFTPPPSRLHVLPPPTSSITPTLALDDAALRPTVGSNHRDGGPLSTTVSSLPSDDHLQNDISDLGSSIFLKDPSQFSSGQKKMIRGKDGSVFIISDERPNMKKEDILSFLHSKPFQKGDFRPSPVDHYITRAYGRIISENPYALQGRQLIRDGHRVWPPSSSDSTNISSPNKITSSRVLRPSQQLSSSRGSSPRFPQDVNSFVKANSEVSDFPVFWVPFVPGVSLPVLMKNKVELNFPSKSGHISPGAQSKAPIKGYSHVQKSSVSAGSTSQEPLTSHRQTDHFKGRTSSTTPAQRPENLLGPRLPSYRRGKAIERGKILFTDNPFRSSDGSSSAWRKPSASVARPSTLFPLSSHNRRPRGPRNTGRPNSIQDIIDGNYDTSEPLYSRYEQHQGLQRERVTSPRQPGLNPTASNFVQQQGVHIGSPSRWVWPSNR